MVSWQALEDLFSRSHTLMLLERFVDRYAVPAGRNIDFSAMARARDDFSHLCEVFEQDLRLGDDCGLAAYCGDHESVLRSAVWRLVGRDDVLAVKGLLVTAEEKERAASWD
ncbi:hypothetical protein JXA12_03545 [Candidatus Woesearchaeota archaeon]|nr:hypothetical protein [Candidatus Woesearchaeota archaeon]